MRYLIFATLLFSSFIFSKCSKSAGSESAYTETCSDTLSFATQVNPVIQTYCTKNSGCHAEGSHDGVLTTYQQIYSQRSSIYSQVKSGRMPEDGSLTSDQRNTILCWISSGAVNN